MAIRLLVGQRPSRADYVRGLPAPRYVAYREAEETRSKEAIERGDGGCFPEGCDCSPEN